MPDRPDFCLLMPVMANRGGFTHSLSPSQGDGVMTRIRQLTLWGALLLLMACAGGHSPQSQNQKEVATPPSFSATRYLTADGFGDTENEAKRQAVAELASIFEARVQAASKARIASSIFNPAEAGGVEVENFEKEVSQLIWVDTDVRLKGIQIGWVGPNATGAGYRAIAILDRSMAAQRWYNDLERLNAEMDADRAALDTQKGRITKLATLNHASALMAQMAVIEGRLSVIGRPETLLDPEAGDLLKEKARLSSQVSFVIRIQGEPSRNFTARLVSNLTESGYAITESMAEAAGAINGTVWIDPLDLNNPKIQFQRALAEITLTDLDADVHVAAITENVRKGHVDEEEAKRMAIDALADQVARKILQALGGMGIKQN